MVTGGFLWPRTKMRALSENDVVAYSKRSKGTNQKAMIIHPTLSPPKDIPFQEENFRKRGLLVLESE